MCKITYEENEVQTANINQAVRLILIMGAGFSKNKSRTNKNKSNLSREIMLKLQPTYLAVISDKSIATEVPFYDMSSFKGLDDFKNWPKENKPYYILSNHPLLKPAI